MSLLGRMYRTKLGTLCKTLETCRTLFSSSADNFSKRSWIQRIKSGSRI